MGWRDPVRCRQVRNRASHLEHSFIAPRAEREPSHGGVEEPRTVRVQTACVAQRMAAQVCVRPWAAGVTACRLSPTGLDDTPPHVGGGFTIRRRSERRERHCRNLDDQIDAVPQRAREPVPVTLGLQRRAPTLAARVASVSTRTRIYGGHEDEHRRKHLRPCRARDMYHPFFEGLS